MYNICTWINWISGNNLHRSESFENFVNWKWAKLCFVMIRLDHNNCFCFNSIDWLIIITRQIVRNDSININIFHFFPNIYYFRPPKDCLKAMKPKKKSSNSNGDEPMESLKASKMSIDWLASQWTKIKRCQQIKESLSLDYHLFYHLIIVLFSVKGIFSPFQIFFPMNCDADLQNGLSNQHLYRCQKVHRIAFMLYNMFSEH